MEKNRENAAKSIQVSDVGSSLKLFFTSFPSDGSGGTIVGSSTGRCKSKRCFKKYEMKFQFVVVDYSLEFHVILLVDCPFDSLFPNSQLLIPQEVSKTEWT